MAPNYKSLCKIIHDSLETPSTLVRTLTSLTTQAERSELRGEYKAIYGVELACHLEGTINKTVAAAAERTKLSVYKSLYLWILNPHERDAILAKEALEQNETNYMALMEIFLGRKSSHITLIKHAYFTSFKRQLDQDIISIEPPHPYQKILIALSASHKAHNDDISQDIAKCDAIRLYQTGEGSPGGVDEGVVLEILSKRSIQHLKCAFSCYKRIYGHNYTKALRRKNANQFEQALRNAVKYLYDPIRYYAKVVYMGMNDSDLGALRVLVSRAGVDLIEIQKVFKKKYGKEMKDFIIECLPCGDCRHFLLTLLAAQ